MSLTLLSACYTHDDGGNAVVETWRAASLLPLSAIDSLMWRQPDSALLALQAFAATPEADSLDAFNGHYCQLLISELLYKNDYPQTNRPDLQQAVSYFDSLSFTLNDRPHAPRRHCGLDPQSPTRNDQIVFLDARAHYINGVGYYERDSLVEACKEYLKALEVMEKHFEEKELVGHRAQFMALAYTHLMVLFSNQYMHEQAIYFGRLSLSFFKRYNATSWHIAWILDEIGAQYDMLDLYDTACYYYNSGLSMMPDSNNLTYRDISTHLAFISYKKEHDPDFVTTRLKELSAQAESDEETLARYAIIGEIFYHEQMYDSAFFYLNEVFHKKESNDSKKQVAEWLVEICHTQGKISESFAYANFLVPYANVEENQSATKSQLTEIYNTFRQDELERMHQKAIAKNKKIVLFIVVGLFVALLAVIVIHLMRKKRFDKQLQMERQLHEMNRKALGGKLKKSNESLRLQKEETKNLLQSLENLQQKENWDTLDYFLKEDICTEIAVLLKGKQIKREAKSDAYPELHLDDTQLSRLNVAVERHFAGFGKTLTDLYPRISRNAMNQCLLYLLNLEDVQIAALLACDYSTVKRRSANLKKMFGTEKEPRQFIRDLVL